MSYRLIRGALATLFAGGITAGFALAQVRQAGATIVYDVKMGGQPGLGKGATKLTIKVNSVDADGTAHATIDYAPAGTPQNALLPFDATITPAGAIVPKFAPVTTTPHIGMSKADEVAMAQSSIGQMIQFTLQPFNAFATSAGTRTGLKIGDSWNAAAGGPFVPALAFVVTGREQHLGRDTFVITFQSAPGATLPLSGQGYYDASGHAVAEVSYKQQSPDGRQTANTDIALEP